MSHFDITQLNLTGKLILIVEDIEINRQVILGMLAPTNATTIVTVNGREAVEKFKSIQPDLVLLDIRMPVMDGVAACKLMRKMDEKVPIVAVTANTAKADIDLYFASGFTDCVGKPINCKSFHLLLSKLIMATNDTSE
jgi:CheY-like chemotaxis protein